jgi:hypothetical protein
MSTIQVYFPSPFPATIVFVGYLTMWGEEIQLLREEEQV